MLNAHISVRKYSPLADAIIVLLIGTTIYGLVSFGEEWRAEFHPSTAIDLSFKSLPIYAIFSTIRASVAYLLSLGFTLVVGYLAAKSKWAEKIIIPLLDILQSIPVLGFLPGLVLGLVALFPGTNVGLELAAIIMIFTGQVWNMTFSFYSSLKSVPTELIEASEVMGMGWRKRLFRLELPFSAVNLAWNSLMSMAGGWFFLSVCEAFTLGEQEYRLPGLGAYMAVAISEGNTLAMILGITTMVGVIVMMDVVVWRPALAWVHRFRLEDVPGVSVSEPFIQLMIRESNIYRIIRKIGRRLSLLYRRIKWSLRDIPLKFARTGNFTSLAVVLRSARSRQIAKATFAAIGLAVLVFMLWKLIALAAIFWTVSPYTWLLILKNTIWTLLRVFVTLFISTLWAVPVGIWIGMSPKRVRIAQPIVQVLASFPAPMLYPLALAAFFYLGVSFDYGSMLLMMLGVQWYILFNVLAGAMRIPQELVYVTNLFEVSTLKRWRTLYVPSVFPALVTGWITAAGGAWNASIVAEFIAYKGQTLTTPGLGSTISIAASEANFPLLAASLAVMVVVVVALNRTFWAKVYELSQTRFRMDL
jgi:NitT/TauT family transport system permease protein